MVEPVGVVQAQTKGWGQSMVTRQNTMVHRIAAAAAAAVVMAPIIGIKTILGWLTAYMIIIGLERMIVSPALDTDGRGPKGLKGLLCDAVLFTSAMTFAWIVLPLWFVAGLYGGLCATLYLGAGMLQSVINGAGSLRITIITTTPTALALVGTPWLLSQMGADTNAVVAVATAVAVFLGICYSAARRLYQSDRNQRRAFELADRKRHEAEQAVAARTAFLQTIAHDLRTPITAIMTGADTLRSETPGHARHQLDMIGDAGRMMNSLLNDLLDQARINAGRLNIYEQAFDLRRMIAQTVRLWQSPIRAKGLRLRLETGGNLPRAVLGDEVRLRQVLNNLISNALKFTDHGTITLRCRSWPDDAGNHALMIEVEDTGSGMDEEQLARLFTPFDQMSNDITARHGGSGLGLSICRDLMRLMDGRLTARSVAGSGTIFNAALTLPPAETVPVADRVSAAPLPYIPSSIPLHVAEASADFTPPKPETSEPDRVAATRPEPSGPASPAPEPVNDPPTDDEPPLRVLVVDDHEINRRAIQLILQPFDCDISMAADGRTALEMASHTQFDVIFMDVRMPELDGRETTRRLRQGGGLNATTPVIAVTADNAPEDQMACSAAGMSAYLAKPLTPAALIATLQSTLEQSASASSAASSAAA
ncbi:MULTISPECIES: ATP-binding protein [unclassified Brevundimonas]|uniref:ATP-binding protein n=1 Tax=unclassified Brevundimonas TaxID=2622653 RepID=UPI0025C1CDAE|nr:MULTISPECIES: ATP-binding protein [unclassified Brevundimonas]